MLAGFDGVLQVDGYAGYNRLGKTDRQGGSPLRLAYCWSHGRREVIKAMPEAGSPIGDEILQRIAALHAIEKQIRGAAPEVRRATRQERSEPLVAELNVFVRAQREQLSRKSNMGHALGYLMNHWDGLCVYLDDGRVEMDNNPVENLIRPLTLNRKNALFAGHDEGGQNWARLSAFTGMLSAITGIPSQGTDGSPRKGRSWCGFAQLGPSVGGRRRHRQPGYSGPRMFFLVSENLNDYSGAS